MRRRSDGYFSVVEYLSKLCGTIWPDLTTAVARRRTYVSRVRDENATLRTQLKERIDENKLLESEFQRQSHIRNEQLRERSYRSGIISRLQRKLRHE